MKAPRRLLFFAQVFLHSRYTIGDASPPIFAPISFS
jgi:hypothetical protein